MIEYKAILKSDNPRLNNMPVRIKVGEQVTSKFKWIQSLCRNATEIEAKWYKEQMEVNL